MTLRLFLDLFKLRIGFAIALTALAGAIAVPGTAQGTHVAIVVFAVLVASAAAGAFNQYVEMDLDKRMARTRGRAFASGKLSRSFLWPLGIAALVTVATGVTAWMVNVQAALYTFLGAFFYGVVYTVWLKRRTWMNIVVGGLAGSFAVLAGAAAVSPEAALHPVSLSLAWILFLWTPPHFWSLAILCCEDYRAAGVPMLPVVKGEKKAANAVFWGAVLLVGSSFLPLLWGLGACYATGAAVGGFLFLRAAWHLKIEPGKFTARRSFLASLSQLSLLLLAAIADPLF